MLYSYEENRPRLFVEEGPRAMEEARCRVAIQLIKSSYVTLDSMSPWSGDNFLHLACLDRLVELGELEEYDQEKQPVGQFRTFRRPLWHADPNVRPQHVAEE